MQSVEVFTDVYLERENEASCGNVLDDFLDFQKITVESHVDLILRLFKSIIWIIFVNSIEPVY